MTAMARLIFSSYTTQKPSLSLASIIVISDLTALQFAGLLYLGVYNCCNIS